MTRRQRRPRAPQPKPRPSPAPPPAPPSPELSVAGTAASSDADVEGGRHRRAPHAGRARPAVTQHYHHYDVHDNEGQLGYILFNTNARSLDAHCTVHEECDCSTGRTIVGWDSSQGGKWTGLRSARGRPLGFLVAWLRLARSSHDSATHLDAMRDARKVGYALYSGRGPARQRAREWVMQTPEMSDLRDAERPQRDGEPLEPDGQF